MYPENCYEKTGQELNEMFDDPDNEFPELAQITLCTCKGDNCNFSSMLNGTQNSLLMLAVGYLFSKFVY